MSDIDNPIPKGNFLTGKLGPLPVWAWGGILGVGVLGFYLLRNRGAASTPVNSTDGSSLDGVDDPFTGPTTGNSNVAPTNPGSASGSPTDNQSWLNQAISGTAGALTASPSAVSSVLSRYLYDGGSFTADEQKYIDKAISLYGAPPQGTGGSATFTGKPSSGSSGGATGALAQNPYSFITVTHPDGSKAIRIVNSNTGKQMTVSGGDYTNLRNWVSSIGKGGSVVTGKTDISKYVSGLA